MDVHRGRQQLFEDLAECAAGIQRMSMQWEADVGLDEVGRQEEHRRIAPAERLEES
jgi:hypothetical protein